MSAAATGSTALIDVLYPVLRHPRLSRLISLPVPLARGCVGRRERARRIDELDWTIGKREHDAAGHLSKR